MHRALFLAAHAGVRIQIVHVSSPVSAELVRGESAAGSPATMEICPHHLLLDLDDLVRLGPYGRARPRCATGALVERLWDYVLDGTADCLVSDHSAYTLEEKEPGWDDIFAAPLGCQVMQETVPLVLDEAFHRRGMPLDAFVRFSSTNAARIGGPVSAQGHAPAGRGRRHRGLRPRRRVGGRRPEPAVLEEPVVAVRRPAGAARGSYARSSAARRSTWTARSSPRPARAGSSPARTTTRSAVPGALRCRGSDVPTRAAQPQHRRAAHDRDARRRARDAARRAAR